MSTENAVLTSTLVRMSTQAADRQALSAPARRATAPPLILPGNVRVAAIAVGVVLLAGVIRALDNYTGAEFSFELFYFVPVLAAAWLLPRSAALMIAAAVVAVWTAGELQVAGVPAGIEVLSPAAIAWNVSHRSLAFLVIAWIVARTREESDRLRLLSEDLDRRNDEVQLTLEKRGEYMSILAHEMRNPLAAIKAAAYVARRKEPDREVIEAIARETDAALMLVDGLREIESIESGRLTSALAPTDLAAVVRDVVRTENVREHEIELRGDDLPLIVLADRRRIAQVVTNLVSNAVRYSPIETKVEVTLGLAPGRKALVQVRDYGPGIPPQERPRLFEKFTRLSTAGGTRGSGLGLFIARAIARDHGGDLTPHWPAGGGTAFSLTIPLAEVSARTLD